MEAAHPPHPTYLWFMMNHGDATWSLEEIGGSCVCVCGELDIEAGARAVTACDDDDRIAIAIEEEIMHHISS